MPSNLAVGCLPAHDSHHRYRPWFGGNRCCNRLQRRHAAVHRSAGSGDRSRDGRIDGNPVLRACNPRIDVGAPQSLATGRNSAGGLGGARRIPPLALRLNFSGPLGNAGQPGDPGDLRGSVCPAMTQKRSMVRFGEAILSAEASWPRKYPSVEKYGLLLSTANGGRQQFGDHLLGATCLKYGLRECAQRRTLQLCGGE